MNWSLMSLVRREISVSLWKRINNVPDNWIIKAITYICWLVFIRPSLRRDVLWYTNVRLSVRLSVHLSVRLSVHLSVRLSICPSVRPFHMLRSNLRTPWPIHFKFYRVTGIDSLTVYTLWWNFEISFQSYETLFIKL